MIDTIEKLIKVYTDVFYIEDPSVITLVAATVLANRMPGNAVWLMIIGASSAGKSELINAITDMEINGERKVWQISAITENTFLSGTVRNGKDASLLNKLGKTGIIVMKDFTTQLSQNPDKAQAIFSQMREIYDGYYTKETGLGQSLAWRGKLGFVGGVTEKIFVLEKKYGGMGTRALNYNMPQASRKAVAKRAIKNSNSIDGLRLTVKEGFQEYINIMTTKADSWPIPELPDDFQETIIDIADFACICRSPTERDYKGSLQLTQEAEMPSRMIQMMVAIANAFMLMNDGDLPMSYRNTVYRIALDSISKQRRLALRELARYNVVTTKGLALKLAYPTTTVHEWLEDLTVFGVVQRIGTEWQDKWMLRPNYKDLMQRFDGVEPIDEELLAVDPTDGAEGEVASPDDVAVHNARMDQLEF